MAAPAAECPGYRRRDHLRAEKLKTPCTCREMAHGGRENSSFVLGVCSLNRMPIGLLDALRVAADAERHSARRSRSPSRTRAIATRHEKARDRAGTRHFRGRPRRDAPLSGPCEGVPEPGTGSPARQPAGDRDCQPDRASRRGCNSLVCFRGLLSTGTGRHGRHDARRGSAPGSARIRAAASRAAGTPSTAPLIEPPKWSACAAGG